MATSHQGLFRLYFSLQEFRLPKEKLARRSGNFEGGQFCQNFEGHAGYSDQENRSNAITGIRHA